MVGDLMKREIIHRLETGVVACDTEDVATISKEALKAGVDSVESIEEGLVMETRIVGEKYTHA